MPHVGALPALALVLGAACGVALDVPAAPLLGSAIPIAAAAWVAWCTRRERVSFWIACAAFALCGAALAAGARVDALNGPLRRLLDARHPGFIFDTIGPPPQHDPISIRLRLSEDAAAGDEVTTLRARVRAVRLEARGTVWTMA